MPKASPITIGIDLGTTNSLIAWGARDKQGHRYEPKIISNVRNSENGLLASCVYYEPGKAADVGKSARCRIKTDPERVAISTKYDMDRGDDDALYAHKQTPIQVAESIIKWLIQGASNLFHQEISSEVCITVPASFPSEMREATITAALNAGLDVTNEILLEESTAALHYFCNKESTDGPLNLCKSKILVFDLGGGTLDVSLHKVTKDEKGLSITDIAKSPYKKFGGDQFDKKVANVLLNNYIGRNPTISRTDPLERQFQLFAEEAKIELTDEINDIKINSLPPKNPSYEINRHPKIPSQPCLPIFRYSLDWSEYEKIIKPFLAEHLCLGDKYCHSRADNIIDPILQVLDDAKAKLNCSERPKIDIVLLNGGMTKLPVIKQRLEELFGTGVRVENDSDKADKAVALGAVFSRLS